MATPNPHQTRNMPSGANQTNATPLTTSVLGPQEDRSTLPTAPQIGAELLSVAPLQHPPNMPLVGSLNSKDPMYYLKASAAQLRLILQSAPEEVRSRIRANASKEAMLDEVICLRQKEALELAALQLQQGQQPPELSDRDALVKILTFDPQELENLVDTSPGEVRHLMQKALVADPTLSPSTVPEDRSNIIITILGWQVHAHKRAAENPAPRAVNFTPAQPALVQEPPPPQPTVRATGQVQDQQTPEANNHPPTLAQLLAPTQPTSAFRAAGDRQENEELDDSEDENENRRKKPKTGIPLESWITGFHTGTDAALEQILSTYPGNRPGANRLNVTSIRGPRIIARIIAKNIDLQEHVAGFPHWKATMTGKPTQAHMEAHTLARMMQLEILSHKSPLEALRHRPSLEVGLRRLYAITYVEKQVARGEIPDKGTAWHNIEFLLESTPDDTAVCDDIEEEMTRRLTQSKRRITATKLIKESDTRRGKRPQNKGANNNKTQGSSNGSDQTQKQQ